MFVILKQKGALCFRVKKETTGDEITFTDRGYQIKLPMHARSTASQAVKNNLRITETMADSNLILAAHKVTKSWLYEKISWWHARIRVSQGCGCEFKVRSQWLPLWLYVEGSGTNLLMVVGFPPGTA